ncbi:MAG: phospho-N-acetylmuramoyl-pentapeptide-transferase, partial [Candidatus Binatia bacterium]
MLYYFLYPLHTTYSAFNVFRYITFRAAMAALAALLISFMFGPSLIRSLSAMQMRQPIRDDGPAGHAVKAGTPTMGGVLIILALFFATVMLADIGNPYITIAVLVTAGFAVIGFIDDSLKLQQKSSRGLPARVKFLLQMLVALAAAILLYRQPFFSSVLAVPFLKNVRP